MSHINNMLHIPFARLDVNENQAISAMMLDSQPDVSAWCVQLPPRPKVTDSQEGRYALSTVSPLLAAAPAH